VGTETIVHQTQKNYARIMPKHSSILIERARWLPEIEKTFIDCLAQEVQTGKQAENRFK